MKKFWLIPAIALAFLFAGCTSDEDEENVTPDEDTIEDTDTDTEPAEEPDNEPVEEPDTDTEPVEEPDTDPEPAEEAWTPIEFDPANPGYTVDFMIMDMVLMGEAKAGAQGTIMRTAREDVDNINFNHRADMIDFCVMGDFPIASPCTVSSDCAPEQQCIKDYDDEGNEVEGSDHCVTQSRTSLDAGPVFIDGFMNGGHQFIFDRNDEFYKMDGQGDGSIDAGLIAHGNNYNLLSENPTPEDLGRFTATFKMPQSINLIQPPVQAGGQFGGLVYLNPTHELTLKWNGNDGNGYVDIMISVTDKASNDPKTLSCRVKDDGEFTLPFELSSQLVIGSGQIVQMMNMIMLTRHAEARIQGDGITVGTIYSEQMMMANVAFGD